MPEKPFDNGSNAEQPYSEQSNVESHQYAADNDQEQSGSGSGDEEHDNDSVEEQLDDEEDKGNDERTPDFSEDEDFGGNQSDEQLCPDLMAERPREHESLNNIIIIDNLPKVDQTKLEKLKAAVAKVYSKCGVCRNEYYPLDADGKTKGFGFFEFESEQMAQEAVKNVDGYRLDKNHTFSVNLMSDFDRLTQMPAEPPDIGNLYWWLTAPNAADQFSVHTEEPKAAAIYVNALSQPTVLAHRTKWTESNLLWSPKGTYLASFHEQGIALWGGSEFRQVQRFAHRGVNYIDFSPLERFLVTLSSHPSNTEAFIVWDLITGQKKRSFPLDQHSPMGTPSYFKWSCHDQYFAKQGHDGIYLYDTETFQLVDKKAIKIPALADFQWSPTDNRIGYWTAEDGNVPARLVLADFNGKFEELRSKTLFNVIDCKVCWQKRGDYLVVKVDRYTKKSGEKNNFRYSGMVYNFEIFHMREKNIPLDTLEVKESILSFSVEPNGHRLIVISGDMGRTNVTCYRMGQGLKSGKIETLKVITQPVTTAIWAPNGQYAVLAAMKAGTSSGGLLVFVDTNDMTIVSKQEHPDLSDIEWDPTGRYVTSSVTVGSAKRDHSFKIWTFQGNLVFEKNLEKLVGFHWRPRPPTVLTEENIKEVRRNRAVWTQKMEYIDRKEKSGQDSEKQEQRRKQLEAFQELREKNARRLAIQKQQRLYLRNGVETDSFDQQPQQGSNVGEEVVEFLIKTEEVEYKP